MAEGKNNAVQERPKVSVIVPVYNIERYLQRCIDSLLVQTYPNIEYIFVDDGSKDASLHILRAAEQKDSRVHVIEQKNAGPSAARNKGIDHSTGKYIMFCDSDDAADPDWCEKMVDAIEASPDSWVICGIRVLSEEDVQISQYIHSGGSKKLPKEEYFPIFTAGLSGSVYNKIYKTEVLLQRRIRFDESLRRGEDVKFNLAYLDCCSDILILDDMLYSYYRYEGIETLTNRIHADAFSGQAMLYRLRKPYIAETYREKFQWWYWTVLSREIEKIMLVFKGYTFFQRLKLCGEFIRAKEYKELLAASGRRELTQWQYQLLNSGRFGMYWFAMMAASAKWKLIKMIRQDKRES